MMKSTLAIFALCVAPLTACVAGADDEWASDAELDELIAEDPALFEAEQFEAEQFQTERTDCVIPPAAHETVALPVGGDVGGERSVTSPNGTYYPGHYVTEITSSGQPNQTAYAENADLTGTCSSNKVETELFCFDTCWYRCSSTSTTSGQLFSAPFGGSYCSASKAISVPAAVSKVRIKARAWNSATPSIGARVREGGQWHF